MLKNSIIILLQKFLNNYVNLIKYIIYDFTIYCLLVNEHIDVEAFFI